MSITTTGKKAKSYEQAIQHLYDFTLRQAYRYNYCMLFEEEDGSLNIVERVGMPCWGAIREYECGTRPHDPWPGDLRGPQHLFPKTGKPIAISFQFHSTSNIDTIDKKNWNRFVSEFAFNVNVSPWRNALGDVELTIKDDAFHGVVFKTTDYDPTILAHLMRNCGQVGSAIPDKWAASVDAKPDIHPALHYLKLKAEAYGFAGRVVIDRFVDGNPFDMCDGVTFYNRASYNRPDRDYLFGGKNNVGEIVTRWSLDKLVAAYNEAKKKAA